MSKLKLTWIIGLMFFVSPLPSYADYAGNCPEYFQKNQILFEEKRVSDVSLYVSWNGGVIEKCQRMEGLENQFRGSDVHFKWNCGGKMFVQERGNYHLGAVIDKNDRLFDIVRASKYRDLASESDARKKNLFSEIKVTCRKLTSDTFLEVSRLTEGKNVEPMLVPVVQIIEQGREYQTFAPSF